MLDGGSDRIQVWDRRNSFRNLSESFRNSKTLKEVLMRFMKIFYHEIYGYRVQCEYLLVCFYRTISSMRYTELTNESIKSVNFSIENATIDQFSNKVNAVFERNSYECYTSFREVAQPIVSKNELLELIK